MFVSRGVMFLHNCGKRILLRLNERSPRIELIVSTCSRENRAVFQTTIYLKHRDDVYQKTICISKNEYVESERVSWRFSSRVSLRVSFHAHAAGNLRMMILWNHVSYDTGRTLAPQLRFEKRIATRNILLPYVTNPAARRLNSGELIKLAK